MVVEQQRSLVAVAGGRRRERNRVNSIARPIGIGLAVLAAILVVGVLVWQGIVASGNPDPTTPGLSRTAMIVSAGVLVFREGLEAVLVLAAVTAGMARTGRSANLRAVPVGALAGFAATIATWFGVVAVLARVSAPETSVQAGTGLLAIVVLLVVMNWFFHKIYWTGWIANHSNRRRRLLEIANAPRARILAGFALLGFTAIYREGFEVVLFLQDLRLRAGNTLVLEGAGLGLLLTAIVAVMTFFGHQHLPYKKMLIVTGVLLGVVLLVMVGEEAQEMQQAGWLASTAIRVPIPDWMGVWFSLFPNVQSLVAQALAGLLVVGSYVTASRVRRRGTVAG